jgi:hypothetical protein
MAAFANLATKTGTGTVFLTTASKVNNMLIASFSLKTLSVAI